MVKRKSRPQIPKFSEAMKIVAGKKILLAAMLVRVQVPPGVQTIRKKSVAELFCQHFFLWRNSRHQLLTMQYNIRQSYNQNRYQNPLQNKNQGQ